MITSGDEGVEPEGSPQGLKGLWIDTILDGLRHGRIDIAVHSAKDLPAADDVGLVIAAVPKRADPRDVLVTRTADLDLDGHIAIGTSSVRRAAQLLAAHPDIEIRPMRGNVDTRLRKLFEGAVSATVLAAAGLARLGLEPTHSRTLGPDEMIPAPGQGCLAVQCREDDRGTRAKLSVLDHPASHQAFDAERALMARLGGGCALPLGALAREKDQRIELVGVVCSPDGRRVARGGARAPTPEDAADAVERVLREQGAGDILAAFG